MRFQLGSTPDRSLLASMSVFRRVKLFLPAQPSGMLPVNLARVKRRGGMAQGAGRHAVSVL